MLLLKIGASIGIQSRLDLSHSVLGCIRLLCGVVGWWRTRAHELVVPEHTDLHLSVNLNKPSMPIVLVVLDRADVVATGLQEEATVPVQFTVEEKALLNLVTESHLPSNTLDDLRVLAELSRDHAVLGFDLFILQICTFN